MSRILDITKNFGLPLTAVIVLLITTYKLSTEIATIQSNNTLRFAELEDKLDEIKREITDNNDKYEKEFTAIRAYIDSKFEIENLKAENYNLRLKILNPEIKLPE